MRLIARSVRNVIRRSGRSILTGVVLVVIITFVLVGLTIKSGTQDSIANAKKSLGDRVTLGINFEKAMQDAQAKMQEQQAGGGNVQRGNFGGMMNMTALDEKTADLLKASSLIEGYDYVYSGAVTANIEAIKIDSSQFGGGGPAFEDNETADDGTVWGGFQVTGNLDLYNNQEFQDNIKVITNDSAAYTAEDVENGAMVCLIDSRVADLNGLKVGDTITVKKQRRRLIQRTPNGVVNQEEEETSSKTYEVKIIGIYADSTSVEENSFNVGNTIYMPYSAIRAISLDGEETGESTINSAVYFLKDPDSSDAFVAEAKSAGVDLEKYTLDFNEAALEKMVGPLKSLDNFANIMIIVVLIAGAVIIMLIMTLNARERKAEIGILRALGAKRGKIAFQFIVETLAISFAALIIGSALGFVTSNSVANLILDNQVAAENEELEKNANQFNMPGGVQMTRPGGAMGGGNQTAQNVSMIDTVTANVGGYELLEILGIAVLVSLIGSLSAVYWVMKYEPMNILNTRE